MGAIYRREMNAFFTSGLAYVFLAVYFIFSGYFFYSGSLLMATTDTSSMFSALFLVVLFLIPILTMKLFAEERKAKTEQIQSQKHVEELYAEAIKAMREYGGQGGYEEDEDDEY